MSDDAYANVRHPDLLGPFVGLRVVDITQHDEEEWKDTKRSYIALHFENGGTLQFPIGDDGFEIQTP